MVRETCFFRTILVSFLLRNKSTASTISFRIFYSIRHTYNNIVIAIGLSKDNDSMAIISIIIFVFVLNTFLRTIIGDAILIKD